MKVNILLVHSIAILTWLFAVVFAFLLALAYYFKIDYIIALPLGILFVFLEYLISPILIDKFFKIRWIYRFKIPRKGISEDDHPNAFTYGHFRGNTRIVLTRGFQGWLIKMN